MVNQSTAMTALLIASLCVRAVFADAPSTQPGSTYDLPGLHGTAAQIKVQLHQELDDLNNKIAAAQGDVRSSQAELKKHRDLVVAQLAKENDTYQYICKTIADAQRELATEPIKARADQLRIKIEGFTKRQKAMEDLAVEKNPDTQPFLADVASKQTTVTRLQAELAKCISWRSDIGSAVRGGAMLQWPASVGTTGIIGAIKITSIEPNGVVAADGELFQPVAQDPGAREGIVTIRGHDVPATFLISGLDDKAISPGQEMLSDKTVRVESSENDGDRMVLRVRRYPSDDDAILEDFHDFIKPGESSLPAR
jgi:hypothetical protein